MSASALVPMRRFAVAPKTLAMLRVLVPGHELRAALNLWRLHTACLKPGDGYLPLRLEDAFRPARPAPRPLRRCRDCGECLTVPRGHWCVLCTAVRQRVLHRVHNATYYAKTRAA